MKKLFILTVFIPFLVLANTNNAKKFLYATNTIESRRYHPYSNSTFPTFVICPDKKSNDKCVAGKKLNETFMISSSTPIVTPGLYVFIEGISGESEGMPSSAIYINTTTKSGSDSITVAPIDKFGYHVSSDQNKRWKKVIDQSSHYSICIQIASSEDCELIKNNYN